MLYNPALDGLRAVTIIFGMTYRAGCLILPGGWLGVDVFFALSGFLITSLLMKEWKSTGAIDFSVS